MVNVIHFSWKFCCCRCECVCVCVWVYNLLHIHWKEIKASKLTQQNINRCYLWLMWSWIIFIFLFVLFCDFCGEYISLLPSGKKSYVFSIAVWQINCKHSVWKQHPFIRPWFWSLGVWEDSAGFSAQDLLRLESGCQSDWASDLEALLSSPLDCWQSSVPCHCRIEVPVSLLAVSQGHS